MLIKESWLTGRRPLFLAIFVLSSGILWFCLVRLVGGLSRTGVQSSRACCLSYSFGYISSLRRSPPFNSFIDKSNTLLLAISRLTGPARFLKVSTIDFHCCGSLYLTTFLIKGVDWMPSLPFCYMRLGVTSLLSVGVWLRGIFRLEGDQADVSPYLPSFFSSSESVWSSIWLL